MKLKVKKISINTLLGHRLLLLTTFLKAQSSMLFIGNAKLAHVLCKKVLNNKQLSCLSILYMCNCALIMLFVTLCGENHDIH